MLDLVIALTKESRKKQALQAQKEKIQNATELQEKSMRKAEQDALEQQRKGETIYEHYQELKEILEEINKARKKFSLQEIKEKLKGHAVIKDVNPKSGEIVVEIR